MNWLITVTAAVGFFPPASPIRNDEKVIFYPTWGYFVSGEKAWKLNVGGMIYEPEPRSLKRNAAVGLARRAMQLVDDSDEAGLFLERMQYFMIDREGGKTISVRFDGDPQGEAYEAGASDDEGEFGKTISLDAETVARLRGKDARPGDWLGFHAVLAARDTRTFSGKVQLVPPEGVSIISDIDDTIKDSNVLDRAELLRNTFSRPYRAVEGMGKLYAQCARAGATFHYVTGSPWQLYVPLEQFLREEGFPAGTYHMRTFDLDVATVADLMTSHEDNKRQGIDPLLAAFPKRKFVLIGDSGEDDPEIYGNAARRNPGQVVGILIRAVKGEAADDARFQSAFDKLDRATWRVFSKPEEIQPVLDDLVKRLAAPADDAPSTKRGTN